jgi:DNA-binding response OmpR family regulator
MRLLLVEDDPNITQALKHTMASAYEVDGVSDGIKAIQLAKSGDYDLVILDLGLPGLPGEEVCKRLREQGYDRPILILSGETKVMSKITLLDLGADDYLTKPFSLGELKARVRVLLRRARQSAYERRALSVGDLTLDRGSHQATREGTIIKLRRKEFALLEYLIQHAGMAVTRQALGGYAWSEQETPYANTIDVHIKYLRDKIDRPFGAPLIRTVHGIGYKLELPAKQPAQQRELAQATA